MAKAKAKDKSGKVAITYTGGHTAVNLRLKGREGRMRFERDGELKTREVDGATARDAVLYGPFEYAQKVTTAAAKDAAVKIEEDK